MRLYDGAPDDELKAHMDDLERCDRELAQHGARATFYPAEEKWAVWVGFRQITEFHQSKRAATDDALRTLKGKK